MKQGNLTEQHRKRAIYPELLKNAQAIGIGCGMDYSFSSKDRLISADGTGESPAVAFYKACNNFGCSFAKSEYARIVLFLPEQVKESQIRAYMEEFSKLVQHEGIQIVGGDTKVVADLSKPCFVCTLFGHADNPRHHNRKEVQVGDELVYAGYPGILGTNRLLSEKREELEAFFSTTFLKKAQFPKEALAIAQVLQIIREEELCERCNIRYVHDVSEGGIYKALWQTGEWMHKGFLVESSKIAIRQETVEICERFDQNPYMLDGTGSVLFVCERGRLLVKKLLEHGIAVGVIGRVTEGKERLVRFAGSEIRKLEDF